MNTALILGVTGQTGAYLSAELLAKGYKVIGSSRDWCDANTWRLKALGVLQSIEKVSLTDLQSLEMVLESIAPNEIYYLAGPSSVAASFDQPLVSMSQIFDPVTRFLEVLRQQSSDAVFVNAASTDCFGDQNGTILTETSRMVPVSPYGVAKTATVSATQTYRGAFDINARNAILTNHESHLRGPTFVTQKIVSGLRDISQGKRKTLTLGDTDIARDWMWAPEVAAALAIIGSSPKPNDYVVASGKTSTLREFATLACAEFQLDPEQVLRRDPALLRPREIKSVELDPSLINSELGWRSKVSLPDLVSRLAKNIL